MIDIWTVIAEHAPTAADGLIDAVHDKPDRARNHPGAGAPRDDIRPGLRAVFHGKYVIYYTFDDFALVVLRVVHGARDQKALLSDA